MLFSFTFQTQNEMILREHLAVLWSSSDFTFTKLHMIEERKNNSSTLWMDNFGYGFYPQESIWSLSSL
ncbi:unnamed protein product [Musa banksii]